LIFNSDHQPLIAAVTCQYRPFRPHDRQLGAFPGSFRTEASIMPVGPAFGGAARPEGRPLACPRRYARRGRRGSRVKGREAIAQRREAPLRREERPRTLRGATEGHYRPAGMRGATEGHSGPRTINGTTEGPTPPVVRRALRQVRAWPMSGDRSH